MSDKPTIFVSAVSKELRKQREIIGKALRFLGCEPVFQDEFGTETGNIRGMLSAKIGPCQALIQLVGHSLGSVVKDARRVRDVMSYTQYEADFAEEKGKRVWYFLVADTWRLPLLAEDGSNLGPETQDETDDQRTYRRKIKGSPNLYHTVADEKDVQIAAFKMLRELDTLREKHTPWLMVDGETSPADEKALTLEGDIRLQLREVFDEYVKKVGPIRQQANPAAEEASEDDLIAQLAKRQGKDPDELRRQLNQTAVAIQQDPTEPLLKRATAAYARREYTEAEKLALEAGEESARRGPEATAKRIKALQLAGDAAREQIKYAQALNHYRAAASLTDKQRNPVEWAVAQHQIARVLGDDGKYKKAETILRRVVEIRKRSLGDEHSDVLLSRNWLGNMLRSQGKYPASEQEHRAVIAIRERVLDAEHPDILRSRNNLAGALQGQGKNAEAEKELRPVMVILQRVLGAEHPNTLAVRANLAVALQAQGKNAAAEQEYRAVLAIRQRVQGAEHPTTLQNRNNLALALQAQGKNAEAEQEHRAVLAIRERILSLDHPDIFQSSFNLALCLEAQKKLKEALAFMQRAEDGWGKGLGSEHRDSKEAKAARERIKAAMRKP